MQHPNIQLSPSAIKEIKRLISDENIPNEKYLRLGVKGGGCAGFSYILEFDLPKNTDYLFNIEGINIALDKAQDIYITGSIIDFKIGLDNRGFVFNNPNADTTCGCGTSFSA
ncbi:MAG: iron-sulfur cluster assembly accessory protein [Chitinophagales bacterium]|nr:iron-sulfur cluster assembly accessory protein [Chitinophagales bacterium]MCZ2393232.1 iron-sulfur cluster assembly accessory protein [Chitinophagales bacterium]